MTNDHRRSLQLTHQHSYGSVYRFERSCILSIVLFPERLSKSRTGLQVSVCLCPSGSSLLVSGSLSLRLPLRSSSTSSFEHPRPFFCGLTLAREVSRSCFAHRGVGLRRFGHWRITKQLGRVQLSCVGLLGALHSEPQSRPAVLPR